MKGLFLFDDLHAEVEVKLKGGRVIPVHLHIEITKHRVDVCAPPSDHGPLNGVVIKPERRCDHGVHFLVFADNLEFSHPTGGNISIDVIGQELLWHPPESDLVALAIHDSMRSWDGQDLRTLRDDMTQSGIARWLDRLADAAGISRYHRSDGRPVEYTHYLI